MRDSAISRRASVSGVKLLGGLAAAAMATALAAAPAEARPGRPSAPRDGAVAFAPGVELQPGTIVIRARERALYLDESRSFSGVEPTDRSIDDPSVDPRPMGAPGLNRPI